MFPRVSINSLALVSFHTVAGVHRDKARPQAYALLSGVIDDE
jgi:hypothetical protein